MTVSKLKDASHNTHKAKRGFFRRISAFAEAFDYDPNDYVFAELRSLRTQTDQLRRTVERLEQAIAESPHK